jgi:hypothetical protein
MVAVATALTALTLSRDANDAHHERSLLDDGSRSQASVEDVYRGRRRQRFVQVTMLILDGDVRGWEVWVYLDPDTANEEGNRVEVAYDPDDPGDVVIVGEQAVPNNRLAVTAGVLTAYVTGHFAWSAWRRRSKAAEVRSPEAQPSNTPTE